MVLDSMNLTKRVPYPARKVRAMFGAWSKIKKQAARIYPEKWALIDPNVEVPPPPPLNLHSPLYKKLWQQQRRKRRLENSQEQQDLLTGVWIMNKIFHIGSSDFKAFEEEGDL